MSAFIQKNEGQLFLIVLSLIYLCFEFSFNSTILDASSTIFDIDSLNSVENFGKILSGVAIALVITPFVFKKSKELSTTLAFFFGTIIFVFIALKIIVHVIVINHDEEFRKNALSIALFKQYVLTNQISLTEINNVAELDKKAFFAVFPFMLMNAKEALPIIEKTKTKLVNLTVKQEHPIDEVYGNYQKAVTEVKKRYNDYASVEKPNVNIEQIIKDKQESGWLSYTTDLAAKGQTVSTVPTHYYEKVRVSVMKQSNISLPKGWNPSDRATFNQAVRDKITKEYKVKIQPYENGFPVSTSSGKSQRIPFGYSWDKFFNSPIIQESLVESLKYHVVKKVNDDYKTEEAFQSAIYDKEADFLIEKSLRKFDSPLSNYAIGGVYYEDSIKACETILVPPIALFLSFLGLLLHLNKTVFLTSRLFTKQFGLIFPMIMLVNSIAYFSVFINTQQGNITENKLFSYLSQENGEHLAALQTIVLGQTFLYGPSEFVRNYFLFGFHFGYKKD